MSPFALLGLPDDAGEAAVKLAWRRLALLHHPDRGGDEETFDRLRRAYREALSQAAVPRQCAACLGSGRTPVAFGWHTTFINCPACGGRGTA